MANNPLLFNAVIAGASGGAQERWNVDNISANYTAFRDAVVRIANAVDAAIPTLPSVSLAQVDLMQSLAQGAFGTRFPQDQSQASFDVLAAAIAAIFTQLSSTFDTSLPLNGLPLSRVRYVDARTFDATPPIATSLQNGSILAPYATIQQALDDLAALGNGGTIYIVPGEYAENLVINNAAQSYSLIGLTQENTGNNAINGILTATAAGIFAIHLANLGSGDWTLTNAAVRVENSRLGNITCSSLQVQGKTPAQLTFNAPGFDDVVVTNDLNGNGFNVAGTVSADTVHCDSCQLGLNVTVTAAAGNSEVTNMPFASQITGPVGHTVTMDQWSNPNVAVVGATKVVV